MSFLFRLIVTLLFLWEEVHYTSIAPCSTSCEDTLAFRSLGRSVYQQSIVMVQSFNL